MSKYLNNRPDESGKIVLILLHLAPGDGPSPGALHGSSPVHVYPPLFITLFRVVQPRTWLLSQAPTLAAARAKNFEITKSVAALYEIRNPGDLLRVRSNISPNPSPTTLAPVRVIAQTRNERPGLVSGNYVFWCARVWGLRGEGGYSIFLKCVCAV